MTSGNLEGIRYVLPWGKAYVFRFFVLDSGCCSLPTDLISGIVRRILLANHKSAFKRIRQNKIRRMKNRVWRARVRTFVKKVQEAVDDNNKEAAEASLTLAIREISRACARGILKKNTASRKVSRLTKRVNRIGATA